MSLKNYEDILYHGPFECNANSSIGELFDLLWDERIMQHILNSTNDILPTKASSRMSPKITM